MLSQYGQIVSRLYGEVIKTTLHNNMSKNKGFPQKKEEVEQFYYDSRDKLSLDRMRDPLGFLLHIIHNLIK